MGMEGEGFGERRGGKVRVNVCQPRMGLNTAGSPDDAWNNTEILQGQTTVSVARVSAGSMVAPASPVISSTNPCLTWQMIHTTAAKCCGRNHLFNRPATSLHIAPRGRGRRECVA